MAIESKTSIPKRRIQYVKSSLPIQSRTALRCLFPPSHRILCTFAKVEKRRKLTPFFPTTLPLIMPFTFRYTFCEMAAVKGVSRNNARTEQWHS